MKDSPLTVAAVVTVLVTALSRGLPSAYAATAVGLCFLGAVYVLVLRNDAIEPADYGLALGGMLEPKKLDYSRLAKQSAKALLFAFIVAAIVFPVFIFAYGLYWARAIHQPFVITIPKGFGEEIMGQLLGVGLPEEAFYRGYLQTALDNKWRPRWRLLGVLVGPSLIVTSAIFAVGHLFTDWNPARLAVFFPSLLFGWMRNRSGGIGAGVVFHAACNLLVIVLSRGYGLVR